MRLGLFYANVFREPPEGHATYDSLLLQNRSSSTYSAHANTEASVRGHCLDSSGKNMVWVGGQRGGNFAKT